MNIDDNPGPDPRLLNFFCKLVCFEICNMIDEHVHNSMLY